MTRRIVLAVFLFLAGLPAATSRFTLEGVLSAPFPSDLTAGPNGMIAWVLNERGARNLWIAEPPDYKGRRLSNYRDDDGQDIDQITWTYDGRSLLYVRGGDFENDGEYPNPAHLQSGVEQDIWIASTTGGAPRKLAEGHSPTLSPRGDRLAFLKDGEIWSVGLEPGAKPAQFVRVRGQAGQLRWSPDGSLLAFTTNRGDHTFLAVFDVSAQTMTYLAPSVDRDSDPAWSPDSKTIAFFRVPAASRVFPAGAVRTAQPWSILLADPKTGQAHELWRADTGTGSAFHAMAATNQLFWSADHRIVFPWEKTGWLHLYSVSIQGGAPTPLNTDGPFEIEHVAISSDRRSILFSSNQNDVDRRHLWRVSAAGGAATPLTPGDGIEWSPIETSDGRAVAWLHSDARNPARAAIQIGGKVRDLAPDSVPSDFPAPSLVPPQAVQFSASDGLQIHGQLFLPGNVAAGEKHPALIFLHGGSRRQMLLGWHYMEYYNHAYAMNQYLASLGFLVLSVNYRSGIGYGLDFREALNYGPTGASEFNDVLAAGLYLRGRADVDPKRIGLWGGSYGGYLTALGLARASDQFAAGVDFHGVHDWNYEYRSSFHPADDPTAARISLESSPISAIGTWRSPVLLIHGDDDRNVAFHQTVLLTEALRKKGVEVEDLIFPDEIHAFLTEQRWLDAYHAAADFLVKHLR